LSHRSVIARAIASARGSLSIPAIKLWSNFTRVSGRCCRDASEENPVPKSSRATPIPSSRSSRRVSMTAEPVCSTLSVSSISIHRGGSSYQRTDGLPGDRRGPLHRRGSLDAALAMKRWCDIAIIVSPFRPGQARALP
jgi:hypothetical protein